MSTHSIFVRTGSRVIQLLHCERVEAYVWPWARLVLCMHSSIHWSFCDGLLYLSGAVGEKKHGV